MNSVGRVSSVAGARTLIIDVLMPIIKILGGSHQRSESLIISALNCGSKVGFAPVRVSAMKLHFPEPSTFSRSLCPLRLSAVFYVLYIARREIRCGVQE